MSGTVKPDRGRRDQVAELMSQGLDNATIAIRLGCSRAAVTGAIAGIRKDLGWQAQ